MAEVIRVVLSTEKVIANQKRKPGFVLLEGICQKDVTLSDVNKAFQLGQATAELKKEEKKKDEGQKK